MNMHVFYVDVMNMNHFVLTEARSSRIPLLRNICLSLTLIIKPSKNTLPQSTQSRSEKTLK